ncbi:MAG: hypothetical protein K8S56_05195 [Candidatus Cloacimonetes bacterium]|nr:hypothetical protein [Candidatus Cloacimonadota bacterium]
METIELTLGNIIDSFAQDNGALQALANVLHGTEFPTEAQPGQVFIKDGNPFIYKEQK